MQLTEEQKDRLSRMDIDPKRKSGIYRQSIIKNKKKSEEYNNHLLDLVEQGKTIKEAHTIANKLAY